MFDKQGQLYFPAGTPFIPNPDHPYWVPEFTGDTIAVNGHVWPYLDVEAKRYRFLFVNGSNARTYEMFLTNQVTKAEGTGDLADRNRRRLPGLPGQDRPERTGQPAAEAPASCPASAPTSSSISPVWRPGPT